MTETRSRSRWRTVATAVIIGFLIWFVTFRTRSCSDARHEVPEAGENEVVWIATFNGL